MIQHRFVATALATALVVGLPAVSVAQEAEEEVTPEGVEWTLTTYLDIRSDEVERVPYGLAPTLLLQDGMASGFAGCNRFDGSYEIDGSGLRFDDQLTVTLALCEEDVQAVEESYLAALAEVDGWILDAGVLELSDGFGDIILAFEVPSILWTAGQMAALTTRLDEMRTLIDAAGLEIESLDRELESQNVDRLRERIKSLERENRQLKKRLDALEEQPASNAGNAGETSFTRAERVLLEGIPKRIATTCAPRRSSLPKNTRAAVTCSPNTSAVSSVNYYLLEGDDAANAFGDTMAEFNVPDATSETCEQGAKSQRYWIGRGWQAEGCFRTNKRAEVRFVDNATDCRKLKVGNKTLQSPALFMELQGTDNDVARVHAWATKNLDSSATQLTSITRPIRRPNAGLSPSCPT